MPETFAVERRRRIVSRTLSIPVGVAFALVLLIAPIAQGSLAREPIAGGFATPVHIAAAPGDPTRLFVVERAGTIRIVNLADHTVRPTPFLNVNDPPFTPVDTQGEGGLISMAFHPDYAANGHFFVYYTCDLHPGTPSIFGSRVSRFTVSSDPNVADPASEVRFFELQQPFPSHNGGMVAFKPNDPNHYLYVSFGDGSASCDTGLRAQDITNKFGSILRFDVDPGPSGDIRNPFAPPGNPFVNAQGDDLIWVYGLRNPFRISFDRLTGDLYIGDVGQVTREEISFQAGTSAGGENYGWNAYEGTVLAPPTCGLISPPLPSMVPPLYEYPRAGGAAVIGGYVYRGPQFASMTGRYFFGDFVQGRIWSFVRNGSGIADLQDHTATVNPAAARISTFGEDANGELYFATFSGDVFRIVDPAPAPPDADQDLLPDELELEIGTDPDDPDTDDDVVIDGIEVEFGTDPLDPFDFPLLPLLRGWPLTAALALTLFGSAVWVYLRRAGHSR